MAKDSNAYDETIRFVVSPTSTDEEIDQSYNAYMDAVRTQWTALDKVGDLSVQLGSKARTGISEALRSTARLGREVLVPPTAFGSYTVTEGVLRAIVRRAIEPLDNVRALKTEIARVGGGVGKVRRLESLTCVIMVSAQHPEIPEQAESVQIAVGAALKRHFAIESVPINVHVEDIYDDFS